MAVALAVAVGLNRIARRRASSGSATTCPVVTSIVAVSVVWRFLYRDSGGLFNTVLGYVGIDGPAWLDSTTLALPSLVVMSVWRNFGTLMVIFLAGLQTVPKEITRPPRSTAPPAGAGSATSPCRCCSPTLLFGAVITGIGYLQFFEEAFVMTKGGPLDSTRSVTFFTYDQFGYGNYGYAAAASYVLFLAIVALTFVQFRWLGERRTEAHDRHSTRPEVTAPEGHRARPTRATPPSHRDSAGTTPGGSTSCWPAASSWWSSRSCGCSCRRSSPSRRSGRCRPPGVPEKPTLENYRTLFTELDFPTYFINSVVVAIAVTVGNLIFCSMLGYALAKLRLPGQAGALRPRARHADGARRGDVRAAVRAGHQHGPGQHAARA